MKGRIDLLTWNGESAQEGEQQQQIAHGAGKGGRQKRENDGRHV